jgi:hypothetical protein
MAISPNYNALGDMLRSGLKADGIRRGNAVKALMAEGKSWEDAFRQVIFPNMSVDEFSQICREHEEIFYVVRQNKT